MANLPNRRQFLSLVGPAGLTGLTGCSQLQSLRDNPPTTPEGTTIASTPTPTPVDDQAPSIISTASEPLQNGTVLAVSMEGEDEGGELDYAAIEYGDRLIKEQVEGQSADISGEMEGIPDANPGEEGQVIYVLSDAAGNETQKTACWDETAPKLDYRPEATEAAAELVLTLEGEDNIGLHEFQVLLNGEPVLTEDVTGSNQISREQTLSADNSEALNPGEMNTVQANLVDAAGNTTSKSVDRYARKHDVMEEPRLKVGAIYHLFFQRQSQWEDCTDAYPRIGRYDPTDRKVISRHTDLMQGFGITSLNLSVALPDAADPFIDSLDYPLPSTMPVEYGYIFRNTIKWRSSFRTVSRQFERTTDYFREDLLERENYEHHNGRPVVTLWNYALPFYRQDEIWEYIQNEWKGYDGWVEYLRDQFTVDGREPYLVGMGDLRTFHPDYASDERRNLYKHIDGITHWFAPRDPSESITWEENMDFNSRFYPYARDFARQYNLDFIPMAYYGFDERSNNCWGQDSYIPRSPSHLLDMLRLAERYRTTDRVNIATFNDWPEAHAVEPGTVRGEEHGTEYLEVIRNFQQGKID